MNTFISAILGFILLCATQFFLAGCSADIPRPGDSAPISNPIPPAPAPGETPSVSDAKKRVDALEKELASAKQDLKDAELHQMAVRCYWIAGILALLALAAGVAAWFLPVLKGRLAAAAVALAGLAAACYWLGQHAWVVPWIGGLVILAGVLYAIYEIRRGHVASRLASEFGDQAEDLAKSLGLAADDPRLIAMKVQAAAKQAGAGIHSLLDRIRS